MSINLLSITLLFIYCSAPGCETPENPPNGKFYLEYNNSISTLLCDYGYRQMGDRVRYCDGYSWLGIQPKCKDEFPSRSIRQQESVNTTIGSAPTFSSEETAVRQLELDILDADNTCFISYIPPPLLGNATSRIQYKYNSVRRQWIMIANYSCDEGYRHANKYSHYRYCKDYNWTARIEPECIIDEEVKNPCDSSNKGGCEQTCVYHGGTSYSCLCNEGFLQTESYFHCEDIDECRLGSGGCEQICNNLPGSYFCSCEDGYISSGDHCIDIDECADEDANGCHGNCVNIPGSYTCDCTASGYRLSDFDNSCIDIDECSENRHDCKDICINTIGTFKCGCSQKGYKLSSDGKTCEDVDECQVRGKRRCHFGACRNNIGSYECVCNEGFKQSKSRRRCRDIDECKDDNGGCSGICVNMAGNFTCECHGGFSLQVDNKSCSDVDECSTGEANCSATCVNTFGSYRCECEDPFQSLDVDGISCKYCKNTEYFVPVTRKCLSCPQNSHTVSVMAASTDDCLCDVGFEKKGDDCVDYDECLTNTTVCEQLCVNTPGSAHCSCHNGYELGRDLKTCFDMDECLLKTDKCDHICSNVESGFICSCKEGYRLGSDGFSCDDIDECFEGYLKCNHFCVNTESSAHCACRDGYRLQSDNFTCIDVDECSEGVDVCEDECINVEGSYKCDCSGPGFKLSWDLASCSDINECMEGVNYCEDTCTNSHGSYSCSCSDGFQLGTDGYSCQDVDECLSNTTNSCQHLCLNTLGHFQCDCHPGYALVSFNLCAACGRGTYRRYGDPECIRCPRYSTTNGVAKSDITDCECIQGYQGNTSLSEDCTRI